VSTVPRSQPIAHTAATRTPCPLSLTFSRSRGNVAGFRVGTCWKGSEKRGTLAAVDLLARLRVALADRYAIERELGHGGMARVYLALDRKHHRQVAIKVLKPELAAALGPDRFLREIETVAQLNHPRILPLHDSGTADGFLYYVMPFVQGETLRSRLDRERRLHATDAVRIIREVASALGYAHDHDVLHRDIKPENILLSGGEAVVADFGIARAIKAATQDRLTGIGYVVGTRGYMSPEQASETGPVDGRSDVYSLGCVLFEMLTGEVPPAQHPAPLHAVPKDLRPAIAKALAFSPEGRFATATEFARALEGAPQFQRLRKAFAVLLWLGLLLGAGVIVNALITTFLSRRSLEPNLVAVAPFDVLDSRFELWHEGLVDYFSKSLDGAGSLRTLSPTVVLRYWRGPGDPVSASELGHRTGAGLVVFGQVVGLGSDSVRVRMTVLEAATRKVLAEPERTDAADRIARLADSLTTDVLRDLGRIGSEGYVRLTSVATRSLPALKAFLRGEQLLRRFSLDSAMREYANAVENDGDFALALRRMGLVRGWKGEVGTSFGLRAGRLNHGMGIRDSLLIAADSLEAASDDTLDRAYWSHRVRKVATLEEAARRYPDDPEVWYELGEARFHLGFVVGTTAQQTIDAFNRAVSIDTAFAPAYVHPLQLALDQNDIAAARRYIDGYRALTSTVAEGAGVRLVDQLLDSPRTQSLALQHVIDSASANVLYDAWRSIQRWPDADEAGVRLLRVLTTGRRGAGVSTDTASTRYLLATELMYRGHLREARALLGPRFTAPFAELAALGVVPADSAATAFDRWLRSTNDRVDTGDPPWVARCYRSFLAAGWWAQRRDTTALLRLMHRGDSVAKVARGVGELVDARADERLAGAALALARRDTTEALRQFLAFPDSLCTRMYGSLSPSLAPLNTVRFQLLAAKGRDREAALVLDRQVTLPLTVGSVLATLERAHVAERLGDRATAVQKYRLVVDVWRNADPELQQYVAEARSALTRLGAR